MPLAPALGRHRQGDLCEFDASLIYRASYRTGSKATEKPCLRKQNKTTTTTTKKKNSVCVCVCAKSLRELTGPLKAGVIGSCESPDVSARN